MVVVYLKTSTVGKNEASIVPTHLVVLCQHHRPKTQPRHDTTLVPVLALAL